MMKREMMKKVIVVMLGMVLAAGASATLIVDQNFDSMTAGTVPSGWTIERDSVYISSAHSFSVANAVEITDSSAWSNYQPRNAMPLGTSLSGNDVTLNFKVYVVFDGTTGQQWEFGLRNGTGSTTGIAGGLRFAMFSTNRMYQAEGDTGYVTFLSSKLNNWWDVQIDYHWDGTKYDSVTTNVNMAGTSLTPWTYAINVASFESFRMDGSTLSNGKVYVDDVQVTMVPEPATLVLLGLGSLIALKRSRK